jgi:uncharacterized protein YbdZ (MbtH family)
MQQVEYQATFISCYGDVRDNSNFYVVCDDEDQDGVWTDGNPNSESGTFANWQEVVEFLSQQPCFDSGIIEITEV